MPRDLEAHYAEQGRRRGIAAREWAAREPYPPLALSPDAAEWCAEMTAGRGVAGVALDRAGAGAWTAALDRPVEPPRLSSITTVLGWLTAAAARDGAIRTPEPGALMPAFASRDRRSEQEVAVGWGLRPHAAEELRIHAEAAIPWDGLAGAPHVTGAAAVELLLRQVVPTFARTRMGNTQSMPWTPLPVGATSWTLPDGS